MSEQLDLDAFVRLVARSSRFAKELDDLQKLIDEYRQLNEIERISARPQLEGMVLRQAEVAAVWAQDALTTARESATEFTDRRIPLRYWERF